MAKIWLEIVIKQPFMSRKFNAPPSIILISNSICQFVHLSILMFWSISSFRPVANLMHHPLWLRGNLKHKIRFQAKIKKHRHCFKMVKKVHIFFYFRKRTVLYWTLLSLRKPFLNQNTYVVKNRYFFLNLSFF